MLTYWYKGQLFISNFPTISPLPICALPLTQVTMTPIFFKLTTAIIVLAAIVSAAPAPNDASQACTQTQRDEGDVINNLENRPMTIFKGSYWRNNRGFLASITNIDNQHDNYVLTAGKSANGISVMTVAMVVDKGNGIEVLKRFRYEFKDGDACNVDLPKPAPTFSPYVYVEDSIKYD